MAVIGNIYKLEKYFGHRDLKIVFEYFKAALDEAAAVHKRIFSLPVGAFEKVNIADDVFALEQGVWTQKSVLWPDEDERDISFGLQTSAAGDYIVIGAPFDDHAYIYKREGSVWSPFTRLAALL